MAGIFKRIAILDERRLFEQMTGPVFRILPALIFALVFLGQGITAPFQNDEETRPAGIVLDLVNHHDWLVPRDLHGELSRKPPLFYWASAAVAEARGGTVDELGARVVSLVAAAASAVVVLEVAGAYFGTPAAWLSYLFLLGTYGFASRAAFARTDTLFTFLVFLGYCALYPLATGEASIWLAIVVGGLLGFAILTKGPLALVLCSGAIAVFLALTRRNPLTILAKPKLWIIIAVALVIASAWYVPAFVRSPNLLQVQFVEENLGHFLPAHLGGTGEAARPFYYTFIRFLGATLPLNLYLVATLAALRLERKSREMLLYQLGFLIVTLGLFTISAAKRDDYILTALPSFAMVIAAPLANDTVDGFSARVADMASGVAAFALLTLALAGLIACSYAAPIAGFSGKLHPSDAEYVRFFLAEARYRPVWIGLIIAVTAVGSAIALRLVWSRNGRAAAFCVAVAELAAVSLWIGVLMPEFARQHTLKSFVLDAKTIVGNHEVMIAGVPNYEVSYYFGRGVPALPKQLVTGNQPRNTPYVLAWSRQVDRFRPNETLSRSSVVLASHPIASRGRMLLLNLDHSSFGRDAQVSPAGER